MSAHILRLAVFGHMWIINKKKVLLDANFILPTGDHIAAALFFYNNDIINFSGENVCFVVYAMVSCHLSFPNMLGKIFIILNASKVNKTSDWQQITCGYWQILINQMIALNLSEIFKKNSCKSVKNSLG